MSSVTSFTVPANTACVSHLTHTHPVWNMGTNRMGGGKMVHKMLAARIKKSLSPIPIVNVSYSTQILHKRVKKSTLYLHTGTQLIGF